MTGYDSLWQALHQALREPPEDLAGALVSLPDAGRLPSPWTTWALIGLVRHRRRQLWVGEVVTERLGGNLAALARRGTLGHPSGLPEHGLVPGLTEWEYLFHGCGCRLTHRGTGEAIDVDFFGPTAEYFDIWFFLDYLRRLRDPEPPEARLIALHRSLEPARLAVAELLEAGLLKSKKKYAAHAFRIAEEVIEREELIDAFCAAWGNSSRRLWLAGLIGDWPAAHDIACSLSDRGISGLISGRAAACKAKRCEDLLTDRFDEGQYGTVLHALDDLDAKCLAEQLEQALDGPAGGATSTALNIVERRDDPAWCPALYELFGRLDPSEEQPQPYLWARCAEFLLRHRYRFDEMRESLVRAGNAVGEAALLALEYDTDRALPLFRRALRSLVPANRSFAAATLALIDRPWSRRELLSVLQEFDEQVATSECRAALRECHDAEAHHAVDAWESAHPHEPEPGPWIKMDEVMLQNNPHWVQWQMKMLHHRVMNVREHVPGPE
jgi:hypothetical protein